jgi:hypothetical protein
MVIKPAKAPDHLAGTEPTSYNHNIKKEPKESPRSVQKSFAPSHTLINLEIKDATAQESFQLAAITMMNQSQPYIDTKPRGL